MFILICTMVTLIILGDDVSWWPLALFVFLFGVFLDLCMHVAQNPNLLGA
jgi:hypothetical protein